MRSAVQVSMLIERPRGCRGRFWAADRVRAARNRHRETAKIPKSANSVPRRRAWRRDHRAASAPKGLLARRFSRGAGRLKDRRRLKLVVRKPSPRTNVARFDSPHKSFNDIITL